MVALSLTPVWAQEAPAPAAPAAPGLPLPAAMIRLSIPDVGAFDAALGGGFKKALYGTLPEDDGVARGFAQSQVGAKLHDQWTRFRGDTAVSFQTLVELQASSAALAVLNIGHMEMVLVLETPLAALPDIFEAGTSRIDSGRTYHLVRTGAADEGASGETRMGLAWSKDRALLVITTSERAMKLALAAVAAGERFAPKLPGLAGLELDLDALRDDLYFKRDFLFGSLPSASESRGKLSAALRLESGRLVEVREGATSAPGSRGAVFEAKDAVASGWIGDASTLLAELRRGVLEPVPNPVARPQLAIAPLPAAKAASAEDRYAISVEVPASSPGGASSEAAEIEAWSALLSAQPVAGFGYLVTPSRARLLAIPWPKEKDADLSALLDATLTRRGARLVPASATGDSRQYVLGPGLPVLAYRRMGEFIWLAPSAADLRSAPAISWSAEVTRFSKLNLQAARDEGRRWARIEGPRSSENVRPLADRVLGLLGWMPAVRTLEVERRVTGSGFKERVVFGVAPPAPPVPSPTPAAK
ncbi:MAG TPA: hypothetical protein PKU70_11790, partial [Vicinamibacteria bacterium]|nr:hypothetical protein [Vicinamibacteria bacterium]